MKNYLIFDIEANGLYKDATHLWCICHKLLGDELNFPLVGHCDQVDFTGFDECLPIMKFIEKLDNNKTKDEFILVGHNIIAYDIPLIERLYGIDLQRYEVIDTLVMSQVFNPDRWKGHSLEAWGNRLGGVNKKIQQEYWDKFDPNMLTRCKIDVKLTEDVLNYLVKENDLGGI